MKRVDLHVMMQMMDCRQRLRSREHKILRGQVLAGDGDGALRGLKKIIKRGTKA